MSTDVTPTPSQIFWNTAALNGVTLGLVASLSVLLSFVNITSSFVANLSFVVFVSLCYSFTARYRDIQLNKLISFKQSFQFILALNLFAFLISGIFNSLNYILHPQLLHDQIKAAAEAYLQLGLIQMGQAEQMLNTATSFNNPFLIVFSSLFMGLLCGCVLGLVISIFVQRKGNPFNQPTT